MFLDLPWKFESNRITLSSSKWRWSLKVIKWSLDDDRVILLDSNFQGRSRNIKVVPVQNFSSIAANIWSPEPIRLTCRKMISGAARSFNAPFVTFINVWQGDTTTVIQYHTSQDHFCSVIDEFPVWNSEPDQPTMMSWATVLEREKVLELLMEI